MTALALPAPHDRVRIAIALPRLPRWARPWERVLDEVDYDETVVKVIAVGGTPVSNTAGATTTQTVTGVGAVAGDVLVAFGFAFSNTAETWAIPAFSDNGTDTGGTAWANRGDSGYVTRNRVIAAERVIGAASGTPPTSVTCSLNAANGQDIALAVFRLTGADTSSPHDASIGNSQVSATPSTGTLVTTNPNDIVLAGICHDGATTTLTPPTGFTAGPETESAASEPFSTGYKVVSATQNQTYQWTLGASRNAVMVVGAWKAASAGATGKGIVFDARRRRHSPLLRRHHDPARDRVSVYMNALRPSWRSSRAGLLTPEYGGSLA